MNKLLVRWTDNQGNKQSKLYDDEKLARKARDWLLSMGAEDADIAIVIKPKDSSENTTDML